MPSPLPEKYTKIVLAERPTGDIVPDKTFRIEKNEHSIRDLEPGEKQVLVRVQYLSLDPAMRSWLNDRRNYMPPVQIGEVMRAEGLGVVVRAGKDSKFSVGQTVKGAFGWTDWAKMDDKLVRLQVPPEGGELIDFLGPFGSVGMTAYFGFFDIGKPKAGEVLVVSGAAGATGSIVCQLGVLSGLTVYAIAGSKDKCEWLEKELGVTKALNYKDADFYDQFKKTIDYFDVYFDNVGGEILNFALTRMKQNARIVLCGAISDYNNTAPKGLTGYMNLISQRGTLQGFIVFDYINRYSEAQEEIAKWVKEGKLKRKFHIVDGLENAPATLPLLYNGGNTGKLVIRVHKDEDVVSANL
ncbi:NAD(P)-binding protein [Auriculariales sp. MPI-PUGE-AT-0066]|nr:NAD(P)-binding protein [Auriculariales sp. MPI-PUGE-AT-0066]